MHGNVESDASVSAPERLIGRIVRLRPQGFPWVAPTWPGSMTRPAPERHLGSNYGAGWSRRYPVRLARAVVLDNLTRPLTHLVASPTVRGDELLELVTAPAIFVANHTSHLDTPLLLSVLPPRLRHRLVVAAAADTFFDRRWKAHLFAFALPAIPIERRRINRQSGDDAAELIEDGWSLIIYPEGGRSTDGWQQEFGGSAAYLAVRTGRPVVPVHIDGTWRVLPKGGERIHRSRTAVTFGTPISPDPGESTRHFNVRIERAVSTLADESHTDWWSARRRSADGSTPSPRGPEGSSWRRAWELGPAPDPNDKNDDRRWALRRR